MGDGKRMKPDVPENIDWDKLEKPLPHMVRTATAEPQYQDATYPLDYQDRARSWSPHDSETIRYKDAPMPDATTVTGATADDPTEAMHFDKGKPPWHLLCWDSVTEVVKVFGWGSKKYDDRNWEKGLYYSQYFSSAHRHMEKWFQRRQNNDEESGLNHLAHAAWNILVLLAYQLRGLDKFDDRPKTWECED